MVASRMTMGQWYQLYDFVKAERETINQRIADRMPINQMALEATKVLKFNVSPGSLKKLFKEIGIELKRGRGNGKQTIKVPTCDLEQLFQSCVHSRIDLPGGLVDAYCKQTGKILVTAIKDALDE